MAKDPILRLTEELTLLPGIGERTALRLSLHLLQQKKERVLSLAQSLMDMAEHVVECSICANLTAYSDLCTICRSKGRDNEVICVVSSIQDLMAVEASQGYGGVYHVLHGVLEPMGGVGPDDLRLAGFQARLDRDEIKEVILATPLSIEGEATALYIKEKILRPDLKITRIASGVPVGGELQYSDRLSLHRAFFMRQHMSK